MAGVTFDAGSVGSVGGAGATTGTVSHVVTSSGGNRLLLVTVAIRGLTTVSGVTYNGTALSFVDRRAGGTTVAVEIWALVAPATGTHNVVVTMPSAEVYDIISSSWTNVDPTTPLQATFGANATSTAPSVTVTNGAVGGMVVDALAYQANTTANVPTVGAGQTSIGTATSGATTAHVVGSSSWEAGAASVTMSYTTASRVWSLLGVAINNLDFTPAGSASDTVTVSDAATRSSPRARATTESVAVSDAAARAAAAFARSAADAATVSDAASRAAPQARTATDTVTLTDAVARLGAAARTASDSVSVGDAAAAGGATRTASDAVTVADAATRAALSRARAAADAVVVADVSSRAFSSSRAAGDSVGVSDVAIVSSGPPVTSLYLRQAGIWVAAALQRRESGVWVDRALTVL